jgi:hypothetical protein
MLGARRSLRESHREVHDDTSASATLRVYVTSTGALIGTLKKLGGSKHAGQFTWPSNAQSLTVRSTAGGSASATVGAK